MKIKEGFVKTEISGKIVAIPVGANTVDFSGVILLNETSSFLWDLLLCDTDKPALLKALTEEYEIDNETALADIETFLNALKEKDFLCE